MILIYKIGLPVGKRLKLKKRKSEKVSGIRYLVNHMS